VLAGTAPPTLPLDETPAKDAGKPAAPPATPRQP
jgi:hypothetical protein